MSGPVLLPLDGSREGMRALPIALTLARTLDAPLELVRVFDVPRSDLTSRAGLLDASDAAHALQAEMRGALDETAAFVARAGVPASAAVLEGDEVAPTLLRHARARGARLLVLATHARGAFARAMLGSVALALAQAAEVPVVLVPPAPGGTDADPVAPIVPAPLRRVLVPLDGSPRARHALDWVLADPALRTRDLVLLEAVVPGTLSGLLPGDVFLDRAGLREQERRARAELDAIVAELGAQGVTARAEVVATTSTADAILDAARTHDADLIAMCTRGLGGIRRLALGSTAEAVVRHAGVPVLLLGPHEGEHAG